MISKSGFLLSSKSTNNQQFLQKKYTCQFIILLKKNCGNFLTNLMIYVIKFELYKSVENITGGVHTHLDGEQY